MKITPYEKCQQLLKLCHSDHSGDIGTYQIQTSPFWMFPLTPRTFSFHSFCVAEVVLVWFCQGTTPRPSNYAPDRSAVSLIGADVLLPQAGCLWQQHSSNPVLPRKMDPDQYWTPKYHPTSFPLCGLKISRHYDNFSTCGPLDIQLCKMQRSWENPWSRLDLDLWELHSCLIIVSLMWSIHFVYDSCLCRRVRT